MNTVKGRGELQNSELKQFLLCHRKRVLLKAERVMKSDPWSRFAISNKRMVGLNAKVAVIVKGLAVVRSSLEFYGENDTYLCWLAVDFASSTENAW